jgi:hypothetical protein
MGGSLGGLISAFPTPVTTSFESIATITPSGVSTITFSGIPSTYKHLQVRAIAKRDTATTSGSSNLRFNGDTGSNYVRHFLRGSGSAASAGAGTAQTSIECFEHTGNEAAVTNMMGVLILDIHDYASTTNNKTIRSLSGTDQNGAGNIYLTSGLWLSTAAVTSLTLFTSANYLNTTFSLYGIKG